MVPPSNRTNPAKLLRPSPFCGGGFFVLGTGFPDDLELNLDHACILVRDFLERAFGQVDDPTVCPWKVVVHADGDRLFVSEIRDFENRPAGVRSMRRRSLLGLEFLPTSGRLPLVARAVIGRTSYLRGTGRGASHCSEQNDTASGRKEGGFVDQGSESSPELGVRRSALG